MHSSNHYQSLRPDAKLDVILRTCICDEETVRAVFSTGARLGLNFISIGPQPSVPQALSAVGRLCDRG